MERYVIANRAGASIYKLTEEKHLVLTKEFENPLGREKNKNLKNDKPGLGRAKRMGSSPHSLTGEKNPREDAVEQFARDLSKDLILQLKTENLLKLKIVAEAGLLGKIKSHFNGENSIHDRVEWINKNLEKIPQNKLLSHLGIQSSSQVEMVNRFQI